MLGVGPIFIVGVGGWYFFDPQLFVAGWDTAGIGPFQAVSSAVSIMFWAFMGVESASVAAAIVENPERNIGRATMYGVAIAAVVYVLSTTAIMGIIPNNELRHSTAPFADAAMRALGPVGAVVISICAIIKASGCLGGWTLINAETALATARDGLFPAMFAHTDSRGVPVRGLFIVSCVMSVIVFLTLSPTVGDAFMVLADISVLLVLTPYIFAAVAVSYYIQKKSTAARLRLGGAADHRLLPGGYHLLRRHCRCDQHGPWVGDRAAVPRLPGIQQTDGPGIRDAKVAACDKSGSSAVSTVNNCNCLLNLFSSIVL